MRGAKIWLLACTILAASACDEKGHLVGGDDEFARSSVIPVHATADTLYFSHQRTDVSAPGPDNGIYRLDLTIEHAKPRLHVALHEVVDVQVHGDKLHALERRPGQSNRILAIDLAPGQASTSTTADGALHFAFDGAYYYALHSQSLRRLATEDEPELFLASVDGSLGPLFHEAGQLYWRTFSGVHRIAADGSEADPMTMAYPSDIDPDHPDMDSSLVLGVFNGDVLMRSAWYTYEYTGEHWSNGDEIVYTIRGDYFVYSLAETPEAAAVLWRDLKAVAVQGSSLVGFDADSHAVEIDLVTNTRLRTGERYTRGFHPFSLFASPDSLFFQLSDNNGRRHLHRASLPAPAP